KNVITGQHPNYQINQKALDAFIENITHIAPPSSAKDEYAKQKNEYVNRENEYVKPQNEYVNEKLETQIIRIIKQNTTAKIEQIVQITQKSKATVWRKLKELKENNQIQYIGPAKNGGYALTTHQTTSQQHTTK
ncbi:MAG: DeoR family transcriptional regulator, partial [Bacteroidales bacterium]|nr:DeoR family transcriptional regulator [Bacteroidales bacterium]